MEFNEIKEKIRRYLDSPRQTPLIVDVANEQEMVLLVMEFNIGSNIFVDASNYCTGDSLPLIEKLQYELAGKTEKVFLTGLTTFLLLQGEEVLKKTIRTILDMEVKGKLVMLTFQCTPLLQFKDRRLVDSGRLVLRDNVKGKLPDVFFVSPKLSNNVDVSLDGISSLSQMVEQDERDVVYVKTNKSRKDFPLSLFNIKQYSSSFDMLIRKYKKLNVLDSDYGTEEQWDYLLTTVDKYDGWQNFLDEELGGSAYLGQNIGKMKTMSANQCWAFFLAMKLHGVKSRPYLSQVLGLSDSLNDLFERLYTQLLNTDCGKKGFKELYSERKNIIESLEIPMSIVSDFCKQAEAKGKKGIYYLTDCTRLEKELILKLIADNAESYDRQSLEQILLIVFPQLANYLATYDYGNNLLTRYFNAYTFDKVTNQIQTEFRNLMEQQATKRDYNVLLQPRSLVLSKQDISHSKAYFVDALGVEFMSYIRELCYEKNLDFEFNIARCNLPSITCQNKEFVQVFNNAGIQLVDVKEIDDLKHEGTGRYNYEHDKRPVHLLAELDVLDKIIENVENDLSHEGIEKVIILSDHGASRLAVINESENKWEVSEKGLHSGRCCPISDISEKPDFATEENDFWCLANYDRFKGGRRAQVEVHGGASLEEVAVPIIIIRKAGDKPKCYIEEDSKVITVSFKKKASIQIFIAKDVDNAKVVLNGKSYEANPTDNKYIYKVDMPEVKRGSYSIDIYIGNTKIAQGLTFEAKSAGASENKYF